MANTKHLTREVRKGVKRAARRKLAETYATLTADDRRAIRKAEEPVGMKEYLIRKKKAAESGEANA